MIKVINKLLGLLSLVLAFSAITMLGTQLINSPDIGYHLDYGYRFFDTFQPVNSSPHLYTVTNKPSVMPEELPPSAWRDHKGQYHFPNANWISQILFAAVYSVWGFKGLSLLESLLVLTAVGFVAATVWRAGVRPAVNASGVLLIALCAFERFSLRPEMVAFALLSAQLYLLLMLHLEKKKQVQRFAGLILLHLLFVNAHSFWILGLALTAAFLFDSLLQPLFQKGPFAGHKRTGIYFFLFCCQVVTSFINPWTWRLALLPLNTGLFFLKNHIASSNLTGHPWLQYLHNGNHPWTVISEFLPSFHMGFFHNVATWAFIIIMMLSLAGILAAVKMKEWWAMIILIGITVFSFAMRRNIAPAAFILVPISIIILNNFFQQYKNVISGSTGTAVALCVSLLIALSGGLLTWAVISNSFLLSGIDHRFGCGPSKTLLPLGACDFLSRTKPSGRVWTDFRCSSNVRFFMKPHPDLPVLTNTWAMPISVMNENFHITSGQISLEQAYRRYGFQVAVLSIQPETCIPVPGIKSIPIARSLVMDSRWDLVYMDVIHAVFVRNNEINKAYANTYRIRMDEQWLTDYIVKLKTVDPVPAAGMLTGAFALRALGFNDCFSRIYEEAGETEGFDRLRNTAVK